MQGSQSSPYLGRRSSESHQAMQKVGHISPGVLGGTIMDHIIKKWFS